MKKYISYRSAELLNALNARKMNFFSIKDAKDILKGSKDIAVRRLLIYMAEKGLLLRIKDGLYNVIPYEKNSEERMYHVRDKENTSWEFWVPYEDVEIELHIKPEYRVK